MSGAPERAVKGAALAALLVTLAAACVTRPPEPRASQPPERIVAVAPSVVETLFALGLGERVVAVGTYVRWPPEAAAKQRIGGLFDPRLEEIVALEPDLAILLPSETKLRGHLERLGVEVLTVQHESIADVHESIETIARRVGVEDAGRRLARELERKLAPRATTGDYRALLVVARESGRLGQVTVVGSGTFLAELAARLGVTNVFADAAQPYPQVGLEEVMARRPDVILELQPELLDSDEAAALVADWGQLDEIPAVRSGCIRVVAGSHVLLPGPRMTQLINELAAAFESCGKMKP